jgi:TolA-binding protein/peroxiredoxin
MLALLVALLALPFPTAQDSEVDRIMLRFRQRASQAKSEELFKKIVLEARADLERFLREKPQDRDAHRAAWHIVESYLIVQEPKQEPKDALEKLESFLRDYPSSEFAAQARFARADQKLQQEDDAGARAAFEEFLKLHPKDERALLARMGVGVTLQNERRYDEAAAILGAVRTEEKGRPEAWGATMQLAVLRHVQGQGPEARAALEEIIRSCPDREAVEVARRHLAQYLKVGQDAPPFAERDLTGGEFSLDRSKGKVVVLYFFDTGLTTAVSEAAFLKRVRKSFKADDVQILGVSVNAERRDLSWFLTEAKVDWPIHFDGKGYEGRLARLYEVRMVPALSVIDRKGHLRFFNVAGRDLRNALAKLLEEK